MRIGSNARKGELRHVGFANDDCAGLAKPLNDWSVIFCRRFVGERRRTCAPHFAGDVEKVFDADDGPIERPKRDALARSSVGCVGCFISFVRIEAEKGALALPEWIADAAES